MRPVVTPPRRSSILRRDAIAVTGLLIMLIGITSLLHRSAADPVLGPPTASMNEHQPSGASPTGSIAASGYLATATELRVRAGLAREGVEPYRGALDGLLAEADAALRRMPRPLNPLDGRKDRFLHDTQDAYSLALAWVMTGDQQYAAHSARFIMAWVSRVDSLRNVCTDRGGSDCLTSLLVSRNAPAFVFAADLLHESGALSLDDEVRLKDWLARLILPAASERTNNWGDAGTFMRIAVSDFVGDGQAFADAVDQWRDAMDLVTADGEIPEESRRGSLGLLYTQGAISYKVGAAVIAQRRGVDLWDHQGTMGGSLRVAVDAFARYWQAPDTWPWHDGRLSIPDVDPAWELIYRRWPEPDYAGIFAGERPLGDANPSAIIWTTLTHGEPIDPALGAAIGESTAVEPVRPTEVLARPNG